MVDFVQWERAWSSAKIRSRGTQGVENYTNQVVTTKNIISRIDFLAVQTERSELQGKDNLMRYLGKHREKVRGFYQQLIQFQQWCFPSIPTSYVFTTTFYFQVNHFNISVQDNVHFYIELSENLMDVNENVIQLSGIQKELWRMVAAGKFMLRTHMSTGATVSLTRNFLFECDYSEEDYIWYFL